MKRITILLTAAALIFSVSAFSQAKDPAPKKDTVIQNIFIFEKTDTIGVPFVWYKGENNNVKYEDNGYLIRKGQAVYTGQTTWRYLITGQEVQYQNPVTIGGLDRTRKKPLNIFL